MDESQLELDFDEWESVTTEEMEERRKERLKETKEKKKASQKSPDELWEEVFSRKNTPKDEEKLRMTYSAWKAGEIEARAKITKAEALRMYARLMEVKREEHLKQMVEETPDNYHLIQTEDELRWICEIWGTEDLVGLDTETDGLDIVHGDNKLVGLSISFPNEDVHVYIPTRHEEGDQLSTEYVMKQLKPYLEDKHKLKVLHNAKFDAHVFSMEGVRLRGIKMDTMLAMWVLNENEPTFKLKDLTNKYAKILGIKAENDTFKDLFGKATFDTIPLDVALVYAAKDTALTVKMYAFIEKQFQRNDLKQIRKLYYEIENPLLDVCIDMEESGFLLNSTKVDSVRTVLKRDEKKVEKELKAELGDINFNSPDQLQKALFEDKGLPVIAKNKSGAPKTDKPTLKKLAEQYEIAEKLLEYRKISKLLSSFIDKLPILVKSTERVYGQFKQNGTDTGRFSSSDPNLQQLPPKARTIFRAPDGRIIIGSDFSQIEPRVLAHITGDEELQRPYKEGYDLYSTLASKTFGVPMEECGDGSTYRKMMKTGLLAVMYGTSMWTLASQLEISVDEAEKFIQDFYDAYPTVKEWIASIHELVAEQEFVETMYGRKRRFPDHAQDAKLLKKLRKEASERMGGDEVPENIWDVKKRLPYKFKRKIHDVNKRVSRVQRQAVNAIIQGSAADIMKIAMIRLHELTLYRNDWLVVGTVHDEALFEVPDDITEDETELIENAMTGATELNVPLKVDVAFMHEWGEETSKDEWFAAA
ncbi:DNA polymerase [Halobacillus ihumii]|uniref:DNA polymerase n=1 Tax=Halobacillus ihumii TaxID=2686092 RepID=UPI0013D6FF88|nr:DNA polymerase [Halobacillus ihumii]